MNVDPNKVQLSERDIEDWLWENPQAFDLGYKKVSHWVARQLHVPSGIIDLLGITESGHPIILEIKNTEIKSEALTQVCRYSADITSALANAEVRFIEEPYYEDLDHYMHKFVLGKSITDQVLFEADALNVQVMVFNVEFSVNISGPWLFSESAQMRHREEHYRLAKEQPIIEIAASLNKLCDRRERKEVESDGE